MWNQFSAKRIEINARTPPEHWFEDTKKQNNHHILDVFDLVIPHVPIPDPRHHRDGEGVAISRLLLHGLFLVIFGLLLSVAGRGRAAVRRGRRVVVGRVQVGRVPLSLRVLLLVPFETFYREGPAALCASVRREEHFKALSFAHPMLLFTLFPRKLCDLTLLITRGQAGTCLSVIKPRLPASFSVSPSAGQPMTHLAQTSSGSIHSVNSGGRPSSCGVSSLSSHAFRTTSQCDPLFIRMHLRMKGRYRPRWWHHCYSETVAAFPLPIGES